MTLNNYFDKIYCINLDERIDRWNEVQIEFDKLGIKNNVERISAIKHIDGRIGCRDTHLKIIQNAKDNGYNKILIFEDDVLIQDDNVKYLQLAIDQLDNFEWSLFYLGATIDPNVGHLTKVSENLVRTNFAYTTHAYAINKNIYDFILQNRININIIDVFYTHYVVPKTISLVMNPMVAIQRDSFSDIEKTKSDYFWMNDFFDKVKSKSGIK